jgi:HemY protein
MVRLLIKLLILVIVVLAAVLLVRDDPGVVMLRYRGWTVDTSLAVALGVLIVFMVALYYLIRLLRGILRMPSALQRRSQNRRYGKARRQLNQGLIDLAEGRFEQAENHLMRLVGSSESPLVHYLAAARAAQLQGKHDARDGYLKAAHEANPAAELAIGVTQAELQLAHGAGDTEPSAQHRTASRLCHHAAGTSLFRARGLAGAGRNPAGCAAQEAGQSKPSA